MEKKAKVNVYAKEAVTIYAYWKDFDGDIKRWKNSIYDMFRWDMTYGYAHDILVYESNANGAYIRLIIKPAFKESVLDTMQELGFRNMSVTHDEIGTIDSTELPEDMLYDIVVID